MRLPHFPLASWTNENKHDLSNIAKILEYLGNPHYSLPKIIHVAGTNGKGSSVAMLKSIFMEAGYKVHCYTSPHLVEFNERIALRGEPISNDYLFEICEKTRLASLRADIKPSFFEGTTAAAFLAFSEVKADILILETGIGGRLDATNIVPPPLTALITPISFDHTGYLGDKLSLIATEKSGIIKPPTPCIISYQADEVYDCLIKKCFDLGVSSFCYSYDFALQKTNSGFLYLSKNLTYEFPAPSLRGDHQLINAASVIALITLINNEFNITAKNIADGLTKTIWPARIQKIDPQKYAHIAANDTQIWIDGAHNDGGAEVLASWIRDELEQPVYLILGMTKNRNIETFCSYFVGLVAGAFTVKVLSEASSYSVETLAMRANKTIAIDFIEADSLGCAIKEIDGYHGRKNIIITGSLFLASDFFKLFA